MKDLKCTGAYTHLCSIIVIVILITGCQNVTNQPFEENPESNYTSTEIIPSYDQHSMRLLSGVFTKGKIVEQGGYFSSDAGNIDLTKALKVQELKDGRYATRSGY